MLLLRCSPIVPARITPPFDFQSSRRARRRDERHFRLDGARTGALGPVITWYGSWARLRRR